MTLDERREALIALIQDAMNVLIRQLDAAKTDAELDEIGVRLSPLSAMLTRVQ